MVCRLHRERSFPGIFGTSIDGLRSWVFGRRYGGECTTPSILFARSLPLNSVVFLFLPQFAYWNLQSYSGLAFFTGQGLTALQDKMRLCKYL